MGQKPMRPKGFLIFLIFPIGILFLFTILHTWDMAKFERYRSGFNSYNLGDIDDQHTKTQLAEDQLDSLLRIGDDVDELEALMEDSGFECWKSESQKGLLSCQLRYLDAVYCERTWSVSIRERSELTTGLVADVQFVEIGWCNDLDQWSDL